MTIVTKTSNGTIYENHDQQAAMYLCNDIFKNEGNTNTKSLVALTVASATISAFNSVVLTARKFKKKESYIPFSINLNNNSSYTFCMYSVTINNIENFTEVCEPLLPFGTGRCTVYRANNNDDSILLQFAIGDLKVCRYVDLLIGIRGGNWCILNYVIDDTSVITSSNTRVFIGYNSNDSKIAFSMNSLPTELPGNELSIDFFDR